jgi:hypothetical protein
MNYEQLNKVGQNYWVFGLFSSSGILETRWQMLGKHPAAYYIDTRNKLDWVLRCSCCYLFTEGNAYISLHETENLSVLSAILTLE